MNHEFGLVDALPGLVWTARPDGHTDRVNRRWCEYTGLTADEACGSGWQIAIHPDDRPGLAERWRAMLSSGRAAEAEARLRRADGQYRWFLFRASPMADAAGRVVAWCGINTDIEELRQATDEAHRAREGHFRAIADSIPALIAVMTPAGELESANSQVLDYFGTSLAELKGWAADDTVHPDDQASVISTWRQSITTGKPYNSEHRMRRSDGTYRWFQVRGLPLRDAEGQIARWYVLETDIQDRKRSSDLLAGETRLLEMITGGQPIPEILEALCLLAEETAGCYCSVVLVDDSGTRLGHGASPSLPASFTTSIVGRPVNTDSSPCAMAAHLNQQVISGNLQSETRWAADDWCRGALAHGLNACWSTPISSTAGKVLGSLATYYDAPRLPTPDDQCLIQQLTRIAGIAIERAQSAVALRRSEAFLAQAQRLTHTGSLWWKVSTNEMAWSDENFRLLGYPASTAPSVERTMDRCHPEDVPLVRGAVDRAIRDGAGMDFEHRLLMPDGSVKHVHVVVQNVGLESGHTEFVGAVTDITERKHAEGELRRAEEALRRGQADLARVSRMTTVGQLTASIAHEVNQPLSGVITNAGTCLRMLADDPPNLEGARETTRRTIRDGNRAADVVSRLRSLFGKKDTVTEPVDLNGAASEVIALALAELERGRVVIQCDLAPDLPAITGDRVQLQQVILNLLVNASDAMSSIQGRPRRLVITTKRDHGEQVRLSVQDVGIGVQPESLDKVFDAFYTTKTGGMGMGLSVSRSIIERHDGRLFVAANDGPGVTFSFSIPCRPEL